MEEEIENEEKEEEFEELSLREVYYLIIKVLRRYVDMDERYYDIIALWIIGTYFHKDFITYPYLFFNASKGSGKTRTLKLISKMAHNGELLVSMSESVLFRTAYNSTICIDELERIASKEKKALRELLNAGYKQGLKVKRLHKNTDKFREKYEIDSFDVFCPIAMANIWGMEDVLADRCISIILEKSNKIGITKLLEIFDYDTDINRITQNLKSLTKNGVVSVVLNAKTIYIVYNYLIHTLTALSTLYTHTTPYTSTLTTQTTTQYIDQAIRDYKLDIDPDDDEKKEQIAEFLLPVIKSKLSSRNLELLFPLLFIAYSVDGVDLLNLIIKVGEEIMSERDKEEFIENRDVMFIDFLSQRDDYVDYVPIKQISREFRKWMGEDEEDKDEKIYTKWANTQWIGKALKRLGLVIDKTRKNKGRIVKINIKKAKERIRTYKYMEPSLEKPPEQPETAHNSDLEPKGNNSILKSSNEEVINGAAGNN